MRKAIVLAVCLLLAAGCASMAVTTAVLPTSGKTIDALGASYNNPVTQDLSTITLFNDKGEPIYSASTGGPGIVKSTTAQTTAGTTFGTTFNSKADNTVQEGGGASATGGKATAGAAAISSSRSSVRSNISNRQSQGQGQLQGQGQGQQQGQTTGPFSPVVQ